MTETPKSEHVAALIAAHGDYDTPAGSVCSILRTLVSQLNAQIETAEQARRRGSKGQRDAYNVITPMILMYADDVLLASRALTPADVEPVPVEPNTDTDALSAFVADRGGAAPATCGMTYIDSTDACLLDPAHVTRADDQVHQARNSRWPVSDTDKAVYRGDVDEVQRLAIYEPLRTAHEGDAAKIVAFIKGETDDLGTETLFSEIAVSGEVTNPDAFALLEATVQPTQPVSAAPVSGGWAAISATEEPSWKPEPRPAPYMLRADAPMPGHVSVSQIETGEACGLQLRLKKRDQIKEQPWWANVGGSAVHFCIESFERAWHGGAWAPGDFALESVDSVGLFTEAFENEIAATAQQSGFPQAQWRTANKGTEGEAWWREHGPEMVHSYAAWSAQQHAEGWAILSTPNGPALESPVALALAGWAMPNAPQTLIGRTDQVWVRQLIGPGPAWEVRVRDPKSGKELPKSTFQLGTYAQSVAIDLLNWNMGRAGVDYLLTAAYYDARNGKEGDVIDPLAAHPVEEVLYRAANVANMHATGVYPANPNTAFGGPCGICGVRYACPIMALKS